MALFEFGAAKRRKACLQRIETALKLAADHFSTARDIQRILIKAGREGMHIDADEIVRDAYTRAHGYLAIAGENTMVGLDKQPSIFVLRPYNPPLDPNDPKIETFFKVFAHHNFPRETTPTPKVAPAKPAPESTPMHQRDGVFALDEERELRAIMPAAPVGQSADEYDGWVFIPTSGPLDADEREWLAHAIWGSGCDTPDDHIPDDATLIHHARLSVKRLNGRLNTDRPCVTAP